MNAQQSAAETAQSLRARLFKPVMAERARIEEGVREATADIEAEQGKHAVVMARWQKQADESRKAFRPEPDRPTPRDQSGHHALLHRAVTARAECSEWEERLLADHVTHIEAAYKQAAPALLKRTRDTPLGKVEQLLPVWQGWLRLLAEARGAAERVGGVRPHQPVRDRMRQMITGADLFEAIDGADLMAPAPLQLPEVMLRNGQRSLDGPTGLTREQAGRERQARLNGGRPGPVF